MKKFFHTHPDIVIASLAVIFLGILIGFYSWAINDIYTDVHQGLTASAAAGSDSFDLDGASKLDLRGIVPSSTSTAPVLTPPTASTTTSDPKDNAFTNNKPVPTSTGSPIPPPTPSGR